MDKEKKTVGRGGARPGAGRKRKDNEMFSFKVGGEIKQRIKDSGNKSAYIINCLREHIEREKQEEQEERRCLPDDALAIVPTSEPLTYYRTSVACGVPFDASSGMEIGEIDLNDTLTTSRDCCFVSHAEGRSMIDAGIYNDDLLIVDYSQTDTDLNKPMLCELNGENTIKYVKVRDNTVYLVPANPDFPTIRVAEDDHFTIRGLVVAAVHKF